MRTHAILSLMLVALATPARAQEHTLDFIWEEAPFPRAHASTIVEATDGTLIAAWFGGSGEGHEDVGVWSSRKLRGGVWSPPVQLYKEPDQPAWNPVLFRGDGDTIWLYFKIGPSPRAWSGAYMKSTTSGEQWTEPAWLPAGMLGPVRAKPIRLAGGDILAGTLAGELPDVVVLDGDQRRRRRVVEQARTAAFRRPGAGPHREHPADPCWRSSRGLSARS